MHAIPAERVRRCPRLCSLHDTDKNLFELMHKLVTDMESAKHEELPSGLGRCPNCAQTASLSFFGKAKDGQRGKALKATKLGPKWTQLEQSEFAVHLCLLYPRRCRSR